MLILLKLYGGKSYLTVFFHPRQTSKSFIFLYSVTSYNPTQNSSIYSIPSQGTGALKGQFVAGSGEGLQLPALVIHEVGYLDFTEYRVTA